MSMKFVCSTYYFIIPSNIFKYFSIFVIYNILKLKNSQLMRLLCLKCPYPWVPETVNISSVFIAALGNHSNWKTRLQMLFPLPKLITNKCSFCQKGKKKKHLAHWTNILYMVLLIVSLR